MRQWAEYRKTISAEHPAYGLARAGDTTKLLLELHGWGDLERKNAKGYSLLMLAAYNGQPEAATLLLERGADPNTQDAGGNSALMGAAFKGDLAMVRLLCARGADPLHRSSSGQTALQMALMFGRSETARYLAERTQSPYRPWIGFLKSFETNTINRGFYFFFDLFTRHL